MRCNLVVLAGLLVGALVAGGAAAAAGGAAAAAERAPPAVAGATRSQSHVEEVISPPVAAAVVPDDTPRAESSIDRPGVGRASGQDLAAKTPDLPRAQLAAGTFWRLRLGTGTSPELGVATPPLALSANRARTQLVVPWMASASLRRFQDGRRFGRGVDVALASYGLVQLGRGERRVDVDLRLPQAEAWWRAYLDESVVRPWYVEFAAGVPGAARGIHAARGGATLAPYRLPVRTQLAVGRGRILPLGPRLRLAKLERLLLDAGLLAGPLPVEVGRQVLLAWWALRAERGYAQRLTRTFELLASAGLLRAEVPQDIVYAFGRIFLDPALAERWEGVDARLAVRYGATWQSGPDAAEHFSGRSTVVLRASHRRVVNLSHNAAYAYEGVLSFAPRRADRSDNLLRTVNPSSPAVDFGRVALVAPVSYRHFFYDPAYNLQKMLAMQARLGVGVDVATPRRGHDAPVNAMAGVGAEAVWLQGNITGLTAALDADVGYAYARLAFAFSLRVGLAFGHDQATYVAP